ncbi:hypothetical protein MPER_04917 [Moniliophthora perniciosa FA553]|nr:hypothetical protein MPER_04917 [Moniliophthora perniciosa FA553]
MATGMIHIPKPLIRLIREDPGVEGCAWFSRRQEDGLLHVLANIIRLACNIILAPPFMVYPIFKSCIIIIYNLIQTSWVVELVDPPGAVLHNPPKDNTDTSAAESGGANQPIANNIPPDNDSNSFV